MRNYSGGYETHFPVLATAVALTEGPVIEFGCGWFSTPMLHLMCRMMDRDLFTLESNQEWMDQFKWMEKEEEPSHKFYQHPNILGYIKDVKRSDFGVCFIDSQPGEDRWKIAEFMSDKAQLIICHDSETDYESGGNYEYEKIRPIFKYSSEYRLMRPYTLILSNCMDFTLSEEEQTWRPENVQG